MTARKRKDGGNMSLSWFQASRYRVYGVSSRIPVRTKMKRGIYMGEKQRVSCYSPSPDLFEIIIGCNTTPTDRLSHHYTFRLAYSPGCNEFLREVVLGKVSKRYTRYRYVER